MNNVTRQSEGRFNPVIPSPTTTDVVIRPSRPNNSSNPNRDQSRRKDRQLARSRKLTIETGRQNSVSANMPRNEQSTLREVVDTEQDRPARDYLHCLVRPDECAARIPDSFSGDTALVTSVTVVRAPVYFTGMGADAGRFALAIRPSLGSLSHPTAYKVAEVRPVQSGANYLWPDDLATPNSFVSSDNGKDIRLDTNYTMLTQPPMAMSSYLGNAATSNDGTPFGNTVTDVCGYGLDVRYAVLGGFSCFLPPPGLFWVSIQLSDLSSAAGLAGISCAGFNGMTLNRIIYGTSTDGTLSTWNGYVTVPTVPLSPPNSILSSAPYLQVTTDINVPLNSANITWTRTFDDVAGIPDDLGLISKYRPVGMSVLTSFTGPALIDGGNIAGALLPGGAVKPQFFTADSTSSNGCLANWENLAAIKGATTNPLVKGNYTWWSPSTLSDYDMKTPSEAATYDYPTIVVAGQSLPGSGTVVDGSNYIRCIITTVYEVSTDSLLLPSRHQRGSQAEMDRVLNHLVGVSHSMENPTHVAFGQKILNAFRSVGSFIWKNRKPIGSAIGMLGTLM